jgi:hypothetical protein
MGRLSTLLSVKRIAQTMQGSHPQLFILSNLFFDERRPPPDRLELCR